MNRILFSGPIYFVRAKLSKDSLLLPTKLGLSQRLRLPLADFSQQFVQSGFLDNRAHGRMINVRRHWIRVLCNRISRSRKYGGTRFRVYWLHFRESCVWFV